MATATLELRSNQVTNGATPAIDLTKPYIARIGIVGSAPLLFHAWNTEAVAAKASAAKNSAAKKEDNIESYVYRTADGILGIPGVNFVGSLIEVGRYNQDPRSPRKSARDLYKAGLIPLDTVAPFTPATETWDYEDRQRVTVQRAAITRTRPAMREGWRIEFSVLVNTPEYIPREKLAEITSTAGRLVGLCDFRPTYGRYAVTSFEAEELG